MMRREIFRTIGTLAIALHMLVPAGGAVAREIDDRPNFVVILADDLGYGDIGVNGAAFYRTPNIDRLALEGVQLTDFMASANICTASRAGLLTGRYPIRTGLGGEAIQPHHTNGLPQSEITLAEALRSVGYRTAAMGKWHLGHQPQFWPTEHGFDRFFGVPYSNDQAPFTLHRNNEVIEEVVDQRTLTQRYTDEAVAFIAESKDEPFFLYIPHTFPHIPLYVDDANNGRSEGGLYGDVVEVLDDSVGRILDALAQYDLDENTIVIFTSDNGPWFEGSSGGFRGRKGGIFGGGYAVPFLARWPGTIPAGLQNDAMAMNFDIWPTLTRLAGYTPSEDLVIDGRDIMPLLVGDETSPHEFLYLFDDQRIAAVRTERWKYVLASFYRGFRAPLEALWGPLLFDVERDPGETVSLVRDNHDVALEMQARVRAGRQSLEILAVEQQPMLPPDVDIGEVLRNQLSTGQPANAGQNTPPPNR